MGSLHCVLENGANLYANKTKGYDSIELAQLIYRKKKDKMQFLTSCVVCHVRIYCFIAYGKKITLIVVSRMLESVPSVRYSSICNVLCLWSTRVIPT